MQAGQKEKVDILKTAVCVSFSHNAALADSGPLLMCPVNRAGSVSEITFFVATIQRCVYMRSGPEISFLRPRSR